MRLVAPAAEQNRDDERTARKPQFQRLGKPRNRERNAPEKHADRDAEKQRDEIRVVEPLQLVPEHFFDFVDRVLGADDVHAVADLQPQRRIRDQHDAGSVDARDGDAHRRVGVEPTERTPVHAFARHDDAPPHDRRLDVIPVFDAPVDDFSEKGLDRSRVFLRGNHQQAVAQLNPRAPGRQHRRIVPAAKPGNDEAAFRELRNFRDRFADDGGILHVDRDGGRVVAARRIRRAQRARFAVEGNFEDGANDQQRKNDADDAERIRARVALPERPRELLDDAVRGRSRGNAARLRDEIRLRLGIRPNDFGERLLRGAETGRVRHGAGKHADHRRHRDFRYEMEKQRHEHAEQHDRGREPVHQHAPFFERGEKAGTDLQTDREDEQNQPELFHEVENMVVDLEAELPEQDPDEEHERDAEGNPEHLHASERYPDRDDEREHQDGVSHAVHIVHE